MVTRETLLTEGLSFLGVSREIVEVAVPRLLTFADLLEREAIPKGFLGPNEAERLLTRHVLGSAAFIRFVPSGGSVIDVGSGSGLPAIVLAAVGTGPVTAIEAQKRRASFLRHVARETELAVDVIAARAEDAARSDLRESADVVTGRALAEFPIALELTLPFVKIGGRALLSAPSERPEDLEAEISGDDPVGSGAKTDTSGSPRARIAQELGGGDPEDVRFEIGPSEEALLWTTIVGKVRPTPDEYPRRPGVPQRRPLRG